MKPFLILQLRPEDETADSEFAAMLRYGQLAGTEVHRVRVERTGLGDLTLTEYAGIIVGGSPFDVSDSDKSELQHSIEAGFDKLFGQIVALDLPFLGCCSGNGLLGRYCGAHISTQFSEPVGGATITLTQEGQADPLLAGMPERIRVLLGHKEACDELPPGCVLLAAGDDCPVQMFRLKENIYATQFHPEGDPDGFIVRINAYKHHGYFPAETADALIGAVSGESTPEAQEILRRFVSRYRAQA